MTRRDTFRRRPVQRRGQQRIDRLLDAADALFAEVGYEQVTTNAIAQRAETSIGSLYQFFADKGAVLRALAERYLARLHAIYDIVLSDASAQVPLAEAYQQVIHALADFHRHNPGFRPLFFGAPTSAGLGEASRVLLEETVRRVAQVLQARAPAVPPERCRLLARLNVETLRALLPLAEEGDEAHRTLVLGEIKRLLVGYLHQALTDGQVTQDQRGLAGG